MSDVAPTEDQQIRQIELIARMSAAIEKQGVGPKRAVEIMDAVEAIVEPIIAIVASDPQSGPQQVERAIEYMSLSAAKRKRHHDELVANRKPRRQQPDEATSELHATADQIAARVQEQTRSDGP